MIGLEVTKAVVGTVSGMGVSYVAGLAIRAVTPQQLGIGGKIMVGVGSAVVGAMVAQKADKFMREYVEDVALGIESLKEIIRFDKGL